MHKLDRVRDELDELLPQTSWVRNTSIAVLLPCYNEEAAIVSVIEGFRHALPSARIYVYDNNSTDGTRHEAAKAGAIVRTEPYQGKGNVVRRMLADIDAIGGELIWRGRTASPPVRIAGMTVAGE